MKLTKTMKITLIIALVACLVSMLGTYAMQHNWGKTKVTQYTVTLSELADMIDANNAANGKNVEVTFRRTNSVIHFAVYEPKSANGKKVPGIVATHGGYNQKEMQMPFYIELARRGFVVVTFDWAGHGRTRESVDADTGNSQGMTAMVEYLMSLQQVNEAKVGVTGHSWSNWGCLAAIRTEAASRNNNIAAYVNQAMGLTVAGVPFMGPGINNDLYYDGLFIALNLCEFDEFDALSGDADYFNQRNVKNAVSVFYPGLDFSSPLQEGMIYTARGPIGVIQDNGQRAVTDRESAIVVYRPPLTHPGFHFSLKGSALVVQQFYAAFGVPDGASFISSASQIWPVVACFQLLGLLGFFALLFPIVSILLQTKVFACLNKNEGAQPQTISIASWKNFIPFILTITALFLYAFFTYNKYYTMGGSVLLPSKYRMAAGNGVGFWTMLSGFFLLMMLLVHYGMRWLFHLKSGEDLGSPFESATVDQFKKFFRAVVFGFAVVGMMFIPVYIAFYVFGADFRIASFLVTPEEPRQILNILVLYLPMWLIFFVPNAIFNSNTRFKELPDWLTTLICACVNALPLILYIAIRYGTLFATGALPAGHSVLAGIVSWALVPGLFFSAFSARFILNRTNNAWAAGVTNALLMCCIVCFANGSVKPDMIVLF